MPHILPAEFELRQKRCVAAMVRDGIDCLIMLPGGNFTYFTGLKFARERHRLLLAVMTRDGELAIMGIRFEAQKMGSGPTDATVETWADDEDQWARVASFIRKRFGAAPVVALEHTTNYYHYLGLHGAVPDASFASPVCATDSVRAIKSDTEIACLREACAKTRARMEKVPAQLVTGMTELDLVALYGPGAMIQFGLTTSMPNEVAGSRRLKEDDVIVIDAGDRVEGYRSDLTRTFFFGEPSIRMREIYGIVDEARLAAIEAARPGAPAEVVDIAAREIIEKAGFGEFFTHRGGHGLGLDFHELPICVAGNKEPLLPGMVLTAEPGIYLPGEFGIRLEDDLLITEDGCEILSR